MPTYLFKCKKCSKEWTTKQSIAIGVTHTDNCPECGKVCENVAFGQGFQFAGKHMDKRLKGFPDYSSKINAGADKDAEEMERLYDAKQQEDLKKGK